MKNNAKKSNSGGGSLKNNSSKAKKVLIVSLTLGLTIGMGTWTIEKYIGPNKKEENKTIAMYLENEEGTYTASTENTFPTDGYVLNVEKSSCRNGGTVTQDASTKKIRLTASKTDACTLYFDKVVVPISEQVLTKLGVTSKGVLASFTDIAPKPTQYQDNNFSGSQYSNNMTDYKTRYITYASSYTFDTSTGLYTLTNPQKCQYSSCYTTLRGKYIVSTYGSTTNAVATSSNLGTIYKIGTGTTTTSMPYISSSKTITNYDYSKDGIFEMEDDYGTSYYYRGAVENNYVKFGKNKSGQDMFWRIIRINGDGSLRIIYDGTSAHANGVSNSNRLALTNVAWNTTNYNDAKYVGYMYGGANGTASTSKEQAQTNETSTNIKTQLETWYKENIVDTGYSASVSDEIFCNDRSFASNNTGTGFGTSTTEYGAYGRVGSGVSNPQPSFKCPEKNDAFTESDTTKGNGALEYPVGLITADEITTSGGRYNQPNGSTNNYKYYLYKGSWYWSLSPNTYTSDAYVFGVNSGGSLNYNYVTYTGGVAPVINLSAEYVNTLIGEGTMELPYRAA